MSAPAAVAGPVERREGGALPRVEVAWPGDGVVAGVTTAALNFGRATEAPAREVQSAFAALGSWARGRFDLVVGGWQVHGAELFRADGVVLPGLASGGPPATLRVPGRDGFLTATPGVLLTVGVADCVPAVVWAPEAGAVALLHAGWRGIAAGIVPRAIAALAAAYGAGPGRLRTWWGPAIGGCCYEVGPEVVDAIAAVAPERATWAREGAGRPRVDLRAALSRQAEAAGVPAGRIAASPLCTACDADLHSYRRARGGGGRMLAFAGLPLGGGEGGGA